MKKYYILFSIFVASFALSACQEQLDLRSNGTIDMSEVWTDRNRTKGYINACYNYIPGNSIDYAAFTDDAVQSREATSGSQYDIWYNQGVTSANFASYNIGGSPWGSLYQGIRKCNVFLANIGSSTAEMLESEREGWSAQAHTLRALYYLELIKRYGSCPLILEDLGTAHDYSTDTKAPVSEVVKQIISDCDAALSVADSEDFSYSYGSGQWGVMTKALAQCIRAEAAMWAVSPLLNDNGFSKEEALTVAADALANLLSHDYSLWTSVGEGHINAYQTYHLTNPNDLRAADKETIYGGSRVAVWSDHGIPTTGGLSSAGSCPSQELVDAYEMANGQPAITGYSDAQHLQPIINSASGYNDSKPYENRDPRFYVSVWYNGSKRGTTVIRTGTGAAHAIKPTDIKSTHTGYYLRKYAADNSNKNSNADGYIRRNTLAEVYYNFAEIAYQVSGPDTKVSGVNMSAREAVNAVRARSGMPEIPSGLSADEFQARYRNDRRVEFAFTSDRYFSLRRWKTLGETAQVTGMTAEGERFAFDPRPTCEDKYLLFPLSLTEANKILTLTGTSWQNPGWE
ncbi:MAG: RagB/SusD family nutrient uptake outer membrane protein [Candidatus Cryptobacteroides sp.]